MEESVSSHDKEITSRYISETLDNLGYSRRRRAARIAYWDKWSVAKTLSTREILRNDKTDKVFVGSNREGIGLEYESDLDVLQVNNAVICLDQENSVQSNEKVIFQLVRHDAPAGYAFLLLSRNSHKQNPYMDKLKLALVRRNGHKYLSSEEIMKINEDVFYQNKGCIGRNTVYMTRNGPSIPKYVNSLEIKLMSKLSATCLNNNIDFVRAFPCSCPDLLNAWCTRQKSSDWPSAETVQQVSNTQVYVVPVGEAGSKDEGLQWRISFIHAEICLVRSFNDTQTKVLILLRHIGHYILYPICADITSYVMKNVMFWLAESCPTECFQEPFLLDRLQDALKLLRSCVENRMLANYMVPERNIFQGRLRNDERQMVLEKIVNIRERCTIFSVQVSRCTDLQTYFPKLNKILQSLEIYNEIDYIDILKSDQLTTKECAEYNTFMFHCSSSLRATLYHFCHVVLPLMVKYKWPIYSLWNYEKDLPGSEATVDRFPSMSVTDDASSSAPNKTDEEPKIDKSPTEAELMTTTSTDIAQHECIQPSPWKPKRQRRKRKKGSQKRHQIVRQAPGIRHQQNIPNEGLIILLPLANDSSFYQFLEIILTVLATMLLLYKILKDEIDIVKFIIVIALRLLF